MRLFKLCCERYAESSGLLIKETLNVSRHVLSPIEEIYGPRHLEIIRISIELASSVFSEVGVMILLQSMSNIKPLVILTDEWHKICSNCYVPPAFYDRYKHSIVHQLAMFNGDGCGGDGDSLHHTGTVYSCINTETVRDPLLAEARHNY